MTKLSQCQADLQRVRAARDQLRADNAFLLQQFDEVAAENETLRQELAECQGTTAPPPTGLSPIAAPIGPFTEVDGNYATDHGIYRSGPGPYAPIKGVYAHEHIRSNISAMNWHDGRSWPVSGAPVVIEDIICEDCHANPPLSLNGTAECNLWVGCNADVKRVVLKRGAWMGLWTGGSAPMGSGGGCWGSIFEDLTIVEQRIGIYVEHTTEGTTFRRLHIEASMTGVNVEWWYNGIGSRSCLFEDGYVKVPSGQPAFFLDAGTYGFTLRNLVIEDGYIALPRNLVDPSKPNVVENVRRLDGTPLTEANGGIVYHSNLIG